MRILMVCLGNICRSPLAEGIMQQKLLKKNIKAVVDSAGMIDYHEGEMPDHRSIAISKKFGIDISKQRSRPFRQNDFEKFEFIFAMDTHNYQSILEFAKNKEEEKKVFLLLEYAGIGYSRSVPDPYYGTLKDFEEVYKLIDRACENIVDKFIKENALKFA